MIVSSRVLGSSTLLAIEQIMPNTWLLASALPSSRSEIGTAAVIDLFGSAPCFKRWRRTTPEAIASTTSLSLPPDAFASALARDSEIETPAKLRSEEIDLLRMVGGDSMAARFSRDVGSEIFPTTSDTLFSMVGMLPAKRTALSIWYIALSNRIEPMSLLPERGSSVLLAGGRASRGWVQSAW